MTSTLSLCKMCARIANYQSQAGIWLCNECRNYMLEMGNVEKAIRHGLEIPPWERTARRRAQEFIEKELGESMLL